MGGDGVDVEGPGGVLPSGGQTDHGGDGENCCGRGVGISPGGGRTRSIGLTPHTVLHLEMSGDHHGTGGMPPHLLNMCWGGEEAGDKPDDEMVESWRDTLIWIAEG